MFVSGRARRPKSRRALLVAGVATLAFSLVVSIAPAMAAKGGNGGAAPAVGGATELPDTSLPARSSGVLATIGVLLIIAAHVGARRTRSLPAA